MDKEKVISVLGTDVSSHKHDAREYETADVNNQNCFLHTNFTQTFPHKMNRGINRDPNRRTPMLERSLSARTLSNSAVKRKDFLRQAFDAISEDQPLQRPFGMVRSKSNRSFRRVQGMIEKNSPESETAESKTSNRRFLRDRQDSLSSFGSIHTTDSTASLLKKTGLLDSISSDFDCSFRADSSVRASFRADNSFRTVDSISLRHKQLKPSSSDDLSSFWGSNPDLGSGPNQTDDLSVFSTHTLMTEMESLSDDNNGFDLANDDDESQLDDILQDSCDGKVIVRLQQSL